MHLLIPFAFCSSEGCHSAVRGLRLPHLEKLLSRLTPDTPDGADGFSLSPPHERALARALHLPLADGMIAWAALQAWQTLQQGGSWAFITPCHWRATAKQVVMSGLPLPDFTAGQSQALMQAMQPYFEEDGITLHYERPDRWLACSPLFDGLASASLDRVVGRNVKDWLPSGSSAGRLQRLQAEMQMLLYSHPVNDARLADGLLPVNSFWLSGCGALAQPAQQATLAAQPLLPTGLRDAALNNDWAAWTQAWTALDATHCAALLATLNRGEGGQLTLCGERSAQSWKPGKTGFLTKFVSVFGTKPLSSVLEQL